VACAINVYYTCVVVVVVMCAIPSWLARINDPLYMCYHHGTAVVVVGFCGEDSASFKRGNGERKRTFCLKSCKVNVAVVFLFFIEAIQFRYKKLALNCRPALSK